MLPKYPNGTLKIGAIVSLSPDSRWAYCNPVGTRGTVIEKGDRGYYERELWMSVQYDDGQIHNYKHAGFDLFAEDEEGFMSTR